MGNSPFGSSDENKAELVQLIALMGAMGLTAQGPKDIALESLLAIEYTLCRRLQHVVRLAGANLSFDRELAALQDEFETYCRAQLGVEPARRYETR